MINSKKNSNASKVVKPTFIQASRNWMHQELNRTRKSEKQVSEAQSIKSEVQPSSKHKLEEVKDEPIISIPDHHEGLSPFQKKPVEHVNPFAQISSKKVDRLCCNFDDAKKPSVPTFSKSKKDLQGAEPKKSIQIMKNVTIRDKNPSEAKVASLNSSLKEKKQIDKP